ncbi:MADS-box protein JOINTLESS [Daucus carota subsp. sativus]|uniref:MADS-box protein JOINTLESS n=1 Tax=Daucus carota subsp. sativus TaxID=79200 RepID=UPI0030837FCA
MTVSQFSMHGIIKLLFVLQHKIDLENKMKNTEIKKIENTGARRVTFCKRKKGIFKKTEELSVLCDADVALIIIDSTGQLFQYASSRMNDILERHSLYLKNLPEKEQTSADKKKQTSAQVQSNHKVNIKNNPLREIRGEILEGMSKEELEQLEKSLENKLSRLVKKKSEMIMIEIETLQQKEMRLMKENIRLKQQVKVPFISILDFFYFFYILFLYCI